MAGADGYDVRKSWNGGISWSAVASNVTGTTTYKIIDPTHHTAGEIIVAVRARDNNVAGPWKQSPATAASRTLFCDQPGHLALDLRRDRRLWNICDITLRACNGGTPITHYAVNLSADGGQSWTRVKNVPATSADQGSGVSTVIEGISDTQAYLVGVASMNRLGGIWQNRNAPAAGAAQRRIPTNLGSVNTTEGGFVNITTTLSLGEAGERDRRLLLRDRVQ